MDKRFIKVLLEEGTPISDIPQEQALAKLNNDIMTVYVMNGLHRGMQPDAFKEEVRTCAVAMYQELTTDPTYRSIRDREIPYIFSNGMKGRLNADKDIGLSYKNLIRWVEGYVKHPERREALHQFNLERMPKPKLIAVHETTDADLERLVNEAWSDWCQFKKDCKQRSETLQKGGRLISEILVTPITCQDFGRIRTNYLRELGIIKDGESLLDLFAREWESGNRSSKFIEKI